MDFIAGAGCAELAIGTGDEILAAYEFVLVDELSKLLCLPVTLLSHMKSIVRERIHHQ